MLPTTWSAPALPAAACPHAGLNAYVEGHRLLDGEIGGLRALEDVIDLIGDATSPVGRAFKQAVNPLPSIALAPKTRAGVARQPPLHLLKASTDCL